MREELKHYDVTSSDEEIVEYLIDEIIWHMAPPTGDASNIDNHLRRIRHAAYLAEKRGEYNALMNKDSAPMMIRMAKIVAIMGSYEKENKRLAEQPWRRWKGVADMLKDAIKDSTKSYFKTEAVKKALAEHANVSSWYVDPPAEKKVEA